MKKLCMLLAALALFVLCITLFPTEVEAASSGTCGDNLTWTLDDNGTLTISGDGEMMDFSSTSAIPWYKLRSNIKTVIVGDGVVSIGEKAFSACNNLTRITIGRYVESINNDAFISCGNLSEVHISDIASWCNINYGNIDSLPLFRAKKLYLNGELVTNLVIPSSVTSINQAAFRYCDSLTSVTIQNGVTSIGGGAFRDCTNLTHVSIENGVTNIGRYAFADCTSLSTITIPNSVTTIDESAFYRCTELSQITIPDSVINIGSSAFSYCTSLTGVTLSKSITNINSHTFYNCESLTSINLPSSVTSIGSYAFSWCSLVSLNIPNSVVSIDESAFKGCTNLIDITIGSGLTSISDCVFMDCAGLTNVIIPDNVTSIGQQAFHGCTGLKEITIGNGLMNIGSSPFLFCDNLNKVNIADIAAWCNVSFYDGNSNPTYLTKKLYLNGELITDLIIPDGVTHISKYAFYNCTSITSVTIPDSVISIDSYAFYSYDSTNLNHITYCGTEDEWDQIVGRLQSVTYTLKLTDIARDYHNWDKATCTEVRTCTICGGTSQGHIWTKATCTTPKTCSTCGKTEGAANSHSVASSICSICHRYGICGDNLTWTLDDAGTLTIEGTGAMWNWDYYVSVGNINSPWQRNNAFIKNIVIGNGVTSVGNAAFASCSVLTSVAIPNSVTSIGDFAFADCSALTTITIPKSVTSIADWAFSFCDSLTSVVYCGTAEEWNRISIDSTNTKLTSAHRSYHSWQDATCVAPKTCRYCAATEGTALAHIWIDATCDTAKHCATCGTTEGAALGHLMRITSIECEPTCTEDGCTYGLECVQCEFVIEPRILKATGHNFVDGTCTTCGKTEGPQVDENLTITSKDMLLGGYIGAQFTVNPEATGAYDSVYIVVVFDGLEYTYEVPLYEGAHVFEHRVAPKYMGEALQITAYGVKGEEVIPGVTVEWSIKDGIMERLAKFYPYIKHAQYKNRCILLVDMLYYGAEAQVRFGTNGNGLVTDGLDAKYVALKTATEPTIEKVNTATKTASNQLYQVNLGVEDAVQMQFTFRLKVEDYSQYLVKITANGTTYEYTGESFIPQGDTSTLKKFVTVVFDKLEAVNMRDEITVELWQNGALLSASYTMSIEGFATASIAADNNVNLLKAMITYGDSAKVSLG